MEALRVRFAELDGVILDVDDVLVDMDAAVNAGIEAIGAPLETRFGPAVGARVQAGFRRAYHLLLDNLLGIRSNSDPEYGAFYAQISDLQSEVVRQGFEVKRWSRDTMLGWALRNEGLEIRDELVREVMAACWDAVAKGSRVANGAPELLQMLTAAGVPYHLATNSDGFLLLRDGRFFYDPAHAIQAKLARLRAVLLELGIDEGAVSVGDPIGKPTPVFASRIIDDFQNLLSRKLRLDRCIAVGDSYTNDIMPLLDQGVGAGIWVRCRGVGECTDARIITVPTLSHWVRRLQ